MDSKIANLMLDLLTEARRGDLPYTEKKSKGAIDKVIVTLEGKQSEKFTKLAKRFKELRALTDELGEQSDALNKEVKEEALELFDATDEIYTRIVETCGLTISIGKRTPDYYADKTTVNYEQIIKDITALVPELSDKVKQIIEANTKVEKELKVAKAPQLRVELKEGNLEGEALEEALNTWKQVVDFVKKTFGAVLRGIKSWGRDYDKRLAALKQLAEA